MEPYQCFVVFFLSAAGKLVIQLYRPVLTYVLYMQHKTGHNSSIGGFSKQSVPEEACSNFTTRCYTAEVKAVGIISVMIQKLVFLIGNDLLSILQYKTQVRHYVLFTKPIIIILALVVFG